MNLSRVFKTFVFTIIVISSLCWGLSFGARPLRSTVLRDSFMDICNLVHDHFFEATSELSAWAQECRTAAKVFPEAGSMDEFLRSTDREFAKLSISHLEVWDPEANRLLWDEEAKETGLRGREIDDHFIIWHIQEGSPAERAGIEAGDEILTINKQELIDATDLRFRAGLFHVKRGDEEFDVDLNIEDIRLEEDTELFELNPDTALLSIPSFLAQHFEDDSGWRVLTREINKYDRVVIDLRANSGGDFVAMLRALSPFFCSPTVVGGLIQPRVKTPDVRDVENDLDIEMQTRVLDGASRVQLKTFDGYPCYKGRVVVLIDEMTASTAEIFATAMTLRPRSELWGRASSGSVVLAAWYPLIRLGLGYKVSIPQAMFETVKGERLEGVGVRPTRSLRYDIDEARDGIDSWLLAAQK